MQNCKTSARTTAKQSSKSSLLFGQPCILAMLLLCAVYCQAQTKIEWGKSYTKKEYDAMIDSIKGSKLISSYAGSKLQLIGYAPPTPKDTVKCYFLEITDTLTTTTKWSKGYVARNSEMIVFGKTQVSSTYLPITSGIVTSELFYEDRKKVVNQCLQVVLVK